MKTKLLMALAVVALILGAVKWASYPTALRAPRMMAQVVDGTTGQPISGARVVISTDIAERGFAMCGSKLNEFYNYATITDADGYFVVPAWGPKPIPSGWSEDSSSPWVQFEKEGYQPGPGWKGFSGGSDNRPSMMDFPAGVVVMSSSWDHRKILLYKNGIFPRGPHSDVIPLNRPVGYVVFAGE